MARRQTEAQIAGLRKAQAAKRKNLPDAEVISRYLAGETTYELAKSYGVGASTIGDLLRRASVPTRPNCPRVGAYVEDRSANWRGGRSVQMDGYVTVAINGGRVREHRRLMELALGRKLGRDEVVHHVDGNRANNDLANLRVMSRSAHQKLHIDERREARRAAKSRGGDDVVSQER